MAVRAYHWGLHVSTGLEEEGQTSRPPQWRIMMDNLVLLGKLLKQTPEEQEQVRTEGLQRILRGESKTLPGIQHNGQCQSCGAVSANLKCSVCKRVYYCSAQVLLSPLLPFSPSPRVPVSPCPPCPFVHVQHAARELTPKTRPAVPEARLEAAQSALQAARRGWRLNSSACIRLKASARPLPSTCILPQDSSWLFMQAFSFSPNMQAPLRFPSLGNSHQSRSLAPQPLAPNSVPAFAYGQLLLPAATAPH